MRLFTSKSRENILFLSSTLLFFRMFSLNHYKKFVTRSEIKGGNDSEIKADKDSLENEGGTTEVVCKSAK